MQTVLRSKSMVCVV